MAPRVMKDGRVMPPEKWGFPGWLDDSQEKVLAEMREEVVKRGMFAKPGIFPDNHMLRFLRARDFDLEKTLAMLAHDLEWRREFEGITFKRTDFPNVYKFAENGSIYRAGFDKDGRPVIVLNLAKMYPREVQDIQEIPRFWVAYVGQVLEECEKAGHGNFTCIIELAGFSPSKNFSMAMVRVLITILQDFYPECLAYALVMNAPALFRMIWNMIVPFLEERTKAKFHLLGSNPKKLFEYISLESLETYYGGKHAAYPVPDQHVKKMATTGILVKTGYFEGLEEPDDSVSVAPSEAGSGKGMKKAFSSRRVMRVRKILSIFDQTRKEDVPTAIEIPKPNPRACVFGATGRTGMLIVRALLEKGYDVCTFVRLDGAGVPATLIALSQKYGSDHLQIVVGDIHDANDLDRAIETSDVVVSAIGAPRSLSTESSFFVTTARAIISSMERLGTRRLVAITAAQAKRMSKAWYDANASVAENGARVAFWSGHYSFIAELEKFVSSHQDKIDFTFVRPAQLCEDQAKANDDKYMTESDTFFLSGGGPVTRVAMAKFIVEECILQKKHIGYGVAIAAPE